MFYPKIIPNEGFGINSLPNGISVSRYSKELVPGYLPNTPFTRPLSKTTENPNATEDQNFLFIFTRGFVKIIFQT